MIEGDVLFDFEKQVEIMQVNMVGEMRAELRSYFPNEGYSPEKTKFATIRKLFPEIGTQTMFYMVSH